MDREMKVFKDQQVHIIYVKCRPILRDPVAAYSTSPMCKVLTKFIPGTAYIPDRIICTLKYTCQLINMLILTISGKKMLFSEIMSSSI